MTFNEPRGKPRRPDLIAPATLSSLGDATFSHRTKNVLANLDGEERATALRQWLVQPAHPIIHDAAVCWAYIKTAILENPSADNKDAKQQQLEDCDEPYTR